MVKRYTITLGASTSAGGKVIGASSNGCINGVRIALEGDAIFCPACKSTGTIRCIEPRISERWNGKQVALADDLCICRCSVPPKLIANQTLRCQHVQTEEAKRPLDSSKLSGLAEDPINENFNDKFMLVDAATGQALHGIEYAIRRANGQLEFGITDSNGCTHLLATTVKAESVDIYT